MMKPEVVNIPVPTMLAITKIIAEKKPISLLSSLLLKLFFNGFPYPTLHPQIMPVPFSVKKNTSPRSIAETIQITWNVDGLGDVGLNT